MVLFTPDAKKNGHASNWITPTTTSMNGNHATTTTTPTSTPSSRPPSTSRKLSKAERLWLREKARLEMRTPHEKQQEEGEELEYQKTPQRTPLSVAIAMKAGTSPTPSSFPDSFWTPFLQQEEHDRRKMAQWLTERQSGARPGATSTPQKKDSMVRRLNLTSGGSAQTTTHAPQRNKSHVVWIANAIAKILRFVLGILLHVAVGMMCLSILDAPYLRRSLETLAFLGRVVLGVTALLATLYLKLAANLAHKILPRLWSFLRRWLGDLTPR